jgi:hypothetical protein
MYFGAVDPTTKVVKVATLDFGIISHQSYITIDNISFIGFNGDHTSFSNGAINLGDASQYVSVTNCEIGFIGASAIWIGAHTTIDNCYLHDTNGQTILGSNSYFTLTNSLIENIGLIYSSMGGWAARGTVMDNDAGTNQLIQYNIFRHVGSFCAKTNGASNVTIDRNLFDDCVSKAFDAGAIYVNGLSSNRTISNNILINTQGSMEGVSGTWDKNGDPNWVTAEAIYLDQPCTGVTVSGNTCAGTIHGSGIKFGNAIGIIASNNTLYNNYYGFEIGSTGTDYPIRNLQFTNNKIIAGPVVVVAPSMMIFGISSSNDASLWGLTASSGEIYCRPIDDGIDKDFYIWNVGGSRGWDTYAAWKSATGETGSTFSSVTAASTNDILFEYNAAKTNKVITLVGNYKDVKGTSYSGSVTLQPYTSIVLIKN